MRAGQGCIRGSGVEVHRYVEEEHRREKDQGGVWKNTYGVYRIAIFLQDHFNNKGGFSVIPASHLVEENEHKIFNEVNT